MLADNMRALAHELNVDFLELKTDDPSTFQLELEHNLLVRFKEYIGGGIQIWCELCQVPKNNQEEAFTEFSHADLLGQGTMGNILGLSKDTKFLTLSRDIEEDLPYGSFRNIVEDFANTAFFWQEEAQKFD